ncbi:hypothetical protein MRX96_054714 [Rhipicephalus microplus]
MGPTGQRFRFSFEADIFVLRKVCEQDPYKAPRLWCAIAEQLSRTLGKPLLGEIFDMARSHGYRILPSAAKKAPGTSGSLSRASSQPSSRIDRAERRTTSVGRDSAAACQRAEPESRNGFTGFGQQRNLGGKRNPDRCLEFLERRLALEAQTREREAALEDRRLAIEERRLTLQESQLQLDIGMHLQRVREFEEAYETRRQEKAMLSQQNELLANVLRALVEKLAK